MTWLLELFLNFGASYIKELLAGAGVILGVFFANRSGKKAGRREVERETQQKHAHDVGLANEADNAHRTRTEKQKQEAWDKWTVK